MDSDKKLQFKDSEIEKIASDLTSAGKKEFGESFKNAAKRIGTQTEAAKPPTEKERFLSAIKKPNEESFDISTLHPDNAPIDKKELYSIVRPLRTYERDIAETVRAKNESVASVNLAAQKKREEKGEPRKAKVERAANKSLVFVVSTVLIIASAGILSSIWYFFLANKPVEVIVTEQKIITTDSSESVDIANLTPADIYEKVLVVMQKTLSNSNLVKINFEENGAAVSIEKFLTSKNFSAPSLLTRALGPKWTFGFQSAEKNYPFFIAEVKSFDNAFAGMIEWEKTVTTNRDLFFIRPGTIITNVRPNSVTNFSDAVIQNKDTRILKDNVGNTVLVYSFIDQNHLLITTNEKTFREILARFFASQSIR